MPASYEGLGVFYLGREVDAETGERTETPVLYDAQDLTTHAFIVGMTGSGKTGLGLGILEEAALDGIPVLAIDPKGDLGNLALTFPDLAPADFRPWIDESKAQREGTSPDDAAAQTAARWRRGLAEWGQDPERIARLREAADVRIYTPGSTAGLGLSVLGDLTPPDIEPGTEIWLDKLSATVSSLLTLVGVDADPINSAAHVYLSALVSRRWEAARSVTVEDLIGLILAPEIDTIGALPVDTYFPEKQRTALAMKLNGLVAAPGYSVWAEGDPLSADTLLYGPDGRPRVSVLSIGHLTDDERMFFVTRLLGEVVGWMRAQSGTGSLRAILYMDEIFGYLPPSANPASKTLLLTLLKQARAFGLGLVLATQNPVDLDYKALSNCGTWFVGRLQTERDKARLLDGLESAGGGFERAEVDRILSGIGTRRFLLHNVHGGAPELMESRWALSYLAGPLTRDHVAELMADAKAAALRAEAPTSDPVDTATAGPLMTPAPEASGGEADTSRPELSVPQVVLAGNEPDVYVPMLLARAEVPFRRARPEVDHTMRVALLAETEGEPDWSAADTLTERPETVAAPAQGAAFAPVPEALAAPDAYPKLERALKQWLQRERPLHLLHSDALGATSAPGEDERAFRVRLGDLAREARDAQKAELQARYAGKLAALEKRIDAAEAAVDRETAQASQRKTDTLVRVGTTLLGAFLGRRGARSTLSQVGVTARSAGRLSKEASDVTRAQAKVDGYQAEYADLDAELTRELEGIDLTFAPETAELEAVELTAKQTEIHVVELALAWVPYRRDADGRLVRA